MSESFEKWAADKDFLFNVKAGEGYINVRHMARDAWQAAQAQAQVDAAGAVEAAAFNAHIDKALWDKHGKAQAVNQQLLHDIVNLLIAARGAIKLGLDVNATNYISAAIAAAQENDNDAQLP